MADADVALKSAYEEVFLPSLKGGLGLPAYLRKNRKYVETETKLNEIAPNLAAGIPLNSVVLSVLGVSALLAAISIVVPIARRLMLPYTLVLAVLGCLIGLLGYLKLGVAGFGGEVAQGLRQIGPADDAFIYIFLPPLLFSAGLTVDVRHIFEDLGYVILLAFVAVILCTFFVGYSLDMVTGLGLLPCLLLGTIGVDDGHRRRHQHLPRGRRRPSGCRRSWKAKRCSTTRRRSRCSAFSSASSRRAPSSTSSERRGSSSSRLAGGALLRLRDGADHADAHLAAAGCGHDRGHPHRRLAYFTFVVSNEILGISGVIATVTLAAFVGSDSRTRVSPGLVGDIAQRLEHLDFWATSFIFVISAMYIPRSLDVFTWHDLANVGVVFVAALASRAVVIGGMMPTFSAIGASKPLGRAYKVVLWWGGMRGAVTVALALATTATDGVPPAVRHLVVSTAIGYVIASLILNGLTLRPLMNAFRLDRFNELDLVMRNRMTALARRKIKRELTEVAAAVGCDAEELSRQIVPMDKAARQKNKAAVGLPLALDTWCHHEIDTVMAFARARADHASSCRAAAQSRRPAAQCAAEFRGSKAIWPSSPICAGAGIAMRLTFWLFARFGWKPDAEVAVAGRVEFLVAELLLLRELVKQCEANAAGLFGRDVAAQLDQLLRTRLEATEAEIKTIEHAYPKFADAMQAALPDAGGARLGGIGIPPPSRRGDDLGRRVRGPRHTTPRRRRAVHAASGIRVRLRQRFRRQQLSVRGGVSGAEVLHTALPRAARPAHHLRPQRKAACVLRRLRAGPRRERRDRPVMLGPGKFFAQRASFDFCTNIARATCEGYVNMLEIDCGRLQSAMASAPALKPHSRTWPRRIEISSASRGSKGEHHAARRCRILHAQRHLPVHRNGLGDAHGQGADFVMAPAHAHLNLLGGVLSAVFGTFYALTKETYSPRLAWINLLLSVAGAFDHDPDAGDASPDQ